MDEMTTDQEVKALRGLLMLDSATVCAILDQKGVTQFSPDVSERRREMVEWLKPKIAAGESLPKLLAEHRSGNLMLLVLTAYLEADDSEVSRIARVLMEGLFLSLMDVKEGKT